MLFRLFLFIWLSFQAAGLSAQGRALPNPDAYPADSLLILLREDTVAQELKAWIVNRTGDTVAISTPRGHLSNWLEVRDEYGEWKCYNCRYKLMCGTGLREFLYLVSNKFTKAELHYAKGDFASEARALFTVDDSVYYSLPIPVRIDPEDIDSPERVMLKRMLAHAGSDIIYQSKAYWHYGAISLSNKKYATSQEALAKALELNPENYRAIMSMGELKLQLVAKSKPSDGEFSEILKEVLKSFLIIPASEKDLQQKIRRWREVYAEWL